MVRRGDKRNEVSEVSNALIECGHGDRWGADRDVFAYLEPPMTLAQAIELEENFDLDDLAALYNQTNASE